MISFIAKFSLLLLQHLLIEIPTLRYFCLIRSSVVRNEYDFHIENIALHIVLMVVFIVSLSDSV